MSKKSKKKKNHIPYHNNIVLQTNIKSVEFKKKKFSFLILLLTLIT